MSGKYLFMFILILTIVGHYNGRHASALIVPEEINTVIMTAIQSTTPVKKGTDSRVGFGFALGNHADFQVMFEFGPQLKTAPVGTSFGSSSRRTRRGSVLLEKVLQTEASQYLQQRAQKMKNFHSNYAAFEGESISGASEILSQEHHKLPNIEDTFNK